MSDNMWKPVYFVFPLVRYLFWLLHRRVRRASIIGTMTKFKFKTLIDYTDSFMD